MGHQIEPIKKFQSLLRKIFQFDSADLDFGIYRIMNYKRDIVEEFISSTLPAFIEEKMGGADLDNALEKARQEVVKVLGPDSFQNGEIAKTLADTPIAKKYLELKNRADSGQNKDALESEVYNHLYAFFSRYYEDGDFISKRRYSQNQRYSIPYNGEEVYFHWANKDQYYIKTDETLRNYQWRSLTGVLVRFSADVVDIERDNVKGAHRFFLPQWPSTKWDAEKRTLTIPFHYRPLTNQEKKKYRGNNRQKNIITESINEAHTHITNEDVLTVLTSPRRPNSNGETETNLEYHLRQYTLRNTSDFFIHKNLEPFLSRELDFYMKNEVLHLEIIERAGESAAERWFHLIRLIKAIGSQIIQFLAQIEEFQKMLWEKKKFVMETNYCIAMHRIPQEFHEEIVTNEQQWKEWETLSLLGDASDRLTQSGSDNERFNYLMEQDTLMLDTIHFNEGFVDRLLSCFDNIDEETDGLLVHGDNWQAPRLLQTRYQNTLRCVHIDPPYNTATSGFLYKNNYQHSSWLSMIHDRIDVAIAMMNQEGAFLCHIDEHEQERLHALFSKMGIPDGGTIIWDKKNPMLGRKHIATQHEYVLYRTWNQDTVFIQSPNREAIQKKATNLINKHGGVNSRSRGEFQSWLKSQQDFSGGELGYKYIEDDGRVHLRAGMAAPEYRTDDKFHQPLVHPVTGETCPVPPNGWSRTPQKLQQLIHENEIFFGKDASVQPLRKVYLSTYQQISSIIRDGGRGKRDLDKIGLTFPYCHPVSLYETLLDGATSQSESYVMDHFAGSGTTAHAVINLNRRDQVKRKFILVEVGEQFDTVLLPRIKKVAFSSDWKKGKPYPSAEKDRSLRIIKYLRLESYEDALDSIEFEQKDTSRLQSIIEDYTLKYMLKWEAKDCETFLNPIQLMTPFDYQLNLYVNGEKSSRTVDVTETFNYLLGMKVQTRKVHMDDSKRYLVFRGETREHPNRITVVIWRNTEDWNEIDLKRDKKFVNEKKITVEADVIYVNGMSSIVGAKPIEPIFKEKMFANISISAQ